LNYNDVGLNIETQVMAEVRRKIIAVGEGIEQNILGYK
jgi:hypothetical protein